MSYKLLEFSDTLKETFNNINKVKTLQNVWFQLMFQLTKGIFFFCYRRVFEERFVGDGTQGCRSRQG